MYSTILIDSKCKQSVIKGAPCQPQAYHTQSHHTAHKVDGWHASCRKTFMWVDDTACFRNVEAPIFKRYTRVCVTHKQCFGTYIEMQLFIVDC